MSRFVSIPKSVFGFRLTPSAFSVYLCLCRHVNISDGCLPDTERIAYECEIPLCDVFNAVFELKKKKLLLPSAVRTILG